jgi:hypothetical protein
VPVRPTGRNSSAQIHSAARGVTKALHLSDVWQRGEAYLDFTKGQVERKHPVGWGAVYVPRACHLGSLEVGIKSGSGLEDAKL